MTDQETCRRDRRRRNRRRRDRRAGRTRARIKLARFLLDNGCDGLNVLGTTGEATSFSLEQRKAVMSAYRRRACRSTG